MQDLVLCRPFGNQPAVELAGKGTEIFQGNPGQFRQEIGGIRDDEMQLFSGVNQLDGGRRLHAFTKNNGQVLDLYPHSRDFGQEIIENLL